MHATTVMIARVLAAAAAFAVVSEKAGDVVEGSTRG